MIKNKNFFLFFTLLFVVYCVHNWINFFYIVSNNVDFAKYYKSVYYFLGLSTNFDYGHGTLYYYLVSVFLIRKIDLIDSVNINFVFNSSVHELNLFLFLIGLWGLYKLLEINKYNKKVILICLILLNFFPQTIYLRSVMKPEILAFSLFPWCLFFIEMFLKSKNVKYLYLSFPALILILNSKPSVTGMTIIYLLVFYIKVFKSIKIKNLIIVTVLFLSLLSVVQIENFQITQLYPFDRVYEEEFDYRANPNILFKVNFREIFKNPFFKYEYQDEFYSVHAKSILNLVILDTFGDHFNQLFDNQLNYFSKNRKNLFISESDSFINKERQIKYNGPFAGFLVNELDYLRKIIASILSIIFYISIIYFSNVSKDKRKYLWAPFVGILVLYLNSLGFPSNNFNPFKGDTFKSFYYSFLLVIAFVFVSAEIIRKNKKIFNFLIIFIFCFSIVFISGHPKSNDQMTSERIVFMNEYSIFCEINNKLLIENNILKKIHPSGNINNQISNCKNYFTNENFINQTSSEYKNENNDACFDETMSIKANSNYAECNIMWIKKIQELEKNENRKPFFSIILFLSMIFIFVSYKKINF